MKATSSPCIGVCSTGIGDSICRGCKRYMHEIVHWIRYSDEEKQAILQRLDTLLSQVVQSKISIVDEERLKLQLQLQKIRHNPTAQAYSWIFDVLKAGAGQIDSLESFGCRVLPEFQSMSLPELRDAIDEDFYVLSSVHYQRYFNVAEESEADKVKGKAL